MIRIIRVEWSTGSSSMRCVSSSTDGGDLRCSYNITDTLLPVVFNNIDNLHNGYIDLNGFIKMVSIIQVLQMKMNAYDPQHTGKVSLDFNGLLDIIMSLPL